MNSSFYRLIIDTSSEHSLMGIAQNKKILASQISIHSNQLSQTLIPSLQTLLEESGVRLDQLGEIAVGIGPGSYTGTRVGVSIARGLSFALKSRLQNSSTQQNRPFEALCAPASSPTLSGMVSSAGYGQPSLSSQSTSKSWFFWVLEFANGSKAACSKEFLLPAGISPPLQGTFACVMPSKTGDFYLLKGLRSQDSLTNIQSLSSGSVGADCAPFFSSDKPDGYNWPFNSASSTRRGARPPDRNAATSPPTSNRNVAECPHRPAWRCRRNRTANSQRCIPASSASRKPSEHPRRQDPPRTRSLQKTSPM